MTRDQQLTAGERTPHAWWIALCRQASAFLAAMRLLTRVPVPEWLFPQGEPSAVSLRASVIYFPLVGSLVGGATAALIAGTELLWGIWLAVLIGLGFEALLTGALHEDAVADFCDAFGAGWSRADVLRILKDSSIGSFGALGLLLAVFLRVQAIAEVAPASRFAALVASATLGRWVILLVMAWLPPVPDRESLTRAFAQQMGVRELAAGTLLAAPGVMLLAWVMPVRLLVVIPALIVTTWLFTCYVRWRIGGATGDCLGFACYVAQVLVLLIVAARVDG